MLHTYTCWFLHIIQIKDLPLSIVLGPSSVVYISQNLTVAHLCLYYSSYFFSFSPNLFARIPNGLILFNLCFLYIYLWCLYWDVQLSFPPHNTPLYIPIACPQAFCPKGSWDMNTPWGCCFHSLWEKHSRDREGERTAERRRQHFSVCLMSL